MFALIVAGRLVQTNFNRIDQLKFVTDIPQADGINHVVVFLTGAEPFPTGMGGQIYFSWPDPQNQIAWHLLGHISNEKPSAIFKISNLKKTAPVLNEFGLPIGGLNPAFFGQGAVTSAVHNAQIGISLEPIDAILNSTPVSTADPPKVSSFVEFTEKMLTNFVNYATSFGDGSSISVNVVHSWYDNFKRRLQQDPNFWKY
ncbi:unnamed protein product [Orchesella dallaii]|uniref:Protein OPI10 n=1 Tax=Orchesella dallaii TaxID=48710 RepID=A0ABP1RR27_9HEXA